jgi:hypothetical protein
MRALMRAITEEFLGPSSLLAAPTIRAARYGQD